MKTKSSMGTALTDIKLYRKGSFYNRIFSQAVKDAQAENRKKGIANVYCFNGNTFYELPDGQITTENPLE